LAPVQLAQAGRCCELRRVAGASSGPRSTGRLSAEPASLLAEPTENIVARPLGEKNEAPVKFLHYFARSSRSSDLGRKPIVENLHGA
jgi:hypothetical protein